ncbi:MAG: TIGR01212 family radical SAM protein [Spartobacteria bacterium]|nr:TIGR01212 family radical SAM protein [Spartobacteria bacterium]
MGMYTTPFYTYKQYMIDRYGEPLFRVPIDAGAGCPHRARGSNQGCTFCPEDGARAVQSADAPDFREQIRLATTFARRRYRARLFMAYFQAYTPSMLAFATYRRILDELRSLGTFRALSIGARPDCLSDALLTCMREVNREIEVWFELGIQTAHDATLRRVNRGHTWADSEAAAHRLHDHGFHVAAHLILGLPGEDETMFQETARCVARLPITGIKIHNLHVIRGTALAGEYMRAPFPLLDHYTYAEHVMALLRVIPADWPVMRLQTDTPEDRLLAPRWPVSKGAFQAYVAQQMDFREWRQGDCGRRPRAIPPVDVAPEDAETCAAKDGSFTFWSDTFKEHYHAPIGALSEARGKYVDPSCLAQSLGRGAVRLLDICFGLGWNAIAAAETALTLADAHPLHITALEMDRCVVRRAAAAMTRTLPHQAMRWRAGLEALYADNQWRHDLVDMRMHWGDARFRIQGLPDNTYDIVFLDPFSTQRNSQLWTVDFFAQIYRVMKHDGVLLTYCAAIPVRSGLLRSGFAVGETEPAGRQRGGTIAAKDAQRALPPLSADDLHLMNETSRGIPYRDPDLCRTNSEILRDRQEAILAWNRRDQAE